MANHPSAEKRNRQRIKKTLRNQSALSSVRTFVRRVRAAIAAKDRTAATEALQVAQSRLSRAAAKGIVHPKAAARTVGRLSAALARLPA